MELTLYSGGGGGADRGTVHLYTSWDTLGFLLFFLLSVPVLISGLLFQFAERAGRQHQKRIASLCIRRPTSDSTEGSEKKRGNIRAEIL